MTNAILASLGLGRPTVLAAQSSATVPDTVEAQIRVLNAQEVDAYMAVNPEHANVVPA